MCFFVIPNDNTIYAIVHSTNINNHKNDRILFENWQLETSLIIQRNGQQSIFPDFHIVDINTFGDPILAVEDYTLTELQNNKEKPMVTIVLLFAKAWPEKFMSLYQK